MKKPEQPQQLTPLFGLYWYQVLADSSENSTIQIFKKSKVLELVERKSKQGQLSLDYNIEGQPTVARIRDLELLIALPTDVSAALLKVIEDLAKTHQQCRIETLHINYREDIYDSRADYGLDETWHYELNTNDVGRFVKMVPFRSFVVTKEDSLIKGQEVAIYIDYQSSQMFYSISCLVSQPVPHYRNVRGSSGSDKTTMLGSNNHKCSVGQSSSVSSYTKSQ